MWLHLGSDRKQGGGSLFISSLWRDSLSGLGRGMNFHTVNGCSERYPLHECGRDSVAYPGQGRARWKSNGVMLLPKGAGWNILLEVALEPLPGSSKES